QIPNIRTGGEARYCGFLLSGCSASRGRSAGRASRPRSQGMNRGELIGAEAARRVRDLSGWICSVQVHANAVRTEDAVREHSAARVGCEPTFGSAVGSNDRSVRPGAGVAADRTHALKGRASLDLAILKRAAKEPNFNPFETRGDLH